MTLAIWPYSLPKSGAVGVSGGPQTNIVSFQPEVGPAIERKRSSSVTETYDIRLNLLSYSQYVKFVDFFDNVIASGTKMFKWVDPMKDFGPRDTFLADEWTLGISAADNDWQGMCWSPELSLFVAVAATGTGDRVMTSPDGITWTSRTSAADNDWQGVCWSPETGLFASVGETGTDNRSMRAIDNSYDTTVKIMKSGDSSYRVTRQTPYLYDIEFKLTVLR